MENKKSFILHYDSLKVLEQLSDEQAGKLLKKMHSYHNGNTYICDENLVNILFIQFANQFDRDMEKYENVCTRNKKNIEKRYATKSTTGKSGIPKSTKSTDNGNDSDNGNDNKKDNNTTPIAVLDFFNETTGAKLKLTDNKRKQIRKRLETFSIEELKTAVRNRMKSQWHIDNGWVKDWDSLFCNDDKIDKMLNVGGETPIKTVKRTFNYLTGEQL